MDEWIMAMQRLHEHMINEAMRKVLAFNTKGPPVDNYNVGMSNFQYYGNQWPLIKHPLSLKTRDMFL